MPVSLTKNQQSEETLRNMAERAFPGAGVMVLEELKEGFFNVAYRLTFGDGHCVILKIAPLPETPIMTHEIGIMKSEVESMRMVRRLTDAPIAEILYFDDSCEICPSPYFFMTCLEGQSFSTCFQQYSPEERALVQEEMGRCTQAFNAIRGERFGYYGQKDRQGTSWYEVFSSMLKDAMEDADRMNIQEPFTQEEILSLAEQDRSYFEAVTEPRFVHWDLWAGNVFVKEGKVTGLIDFERCLWGDPLLEVGFRTYGIREAFLKGYGRGPLTEEERIRAEWYDVYLFLIGILECDYRGYETLDFYHMYTKNLTEWIGRIRERQKAQ